MYKIALVFWSKIFLKIVNIKKKLYINKNETSRLII